MTQKNPDSVAARYQPFQAYIDKRGCLSWAVEAAPCEAVCPLGIDIESYVTAIARGQPDRAIAIIREKCALPGVCGRVCHRPCESECKRGKIDEPIAIMALKRYAADYEHERCQRRIEPPSVKKREVAIIGSGPAGLTAAHDLAKKGHGVVIYEAQPIAGGMLAIGIPEFILPKEVLQADIDYIRSLGVDIKTNIRIGKDISIPNLVEQGFRAVLLAFGAEANNSLPIPGIGLEGVIPALSLLREVKLDLGRALPGRVVVIGGGNVAIDAARTALRLGAAEVHIHCIESKNDMPAFGWEVKVAEAEGVKTHPMQAPQRIRSVDGKKTSYVDFRNVADYKRDSFGRISWTLAENSESSIAADYVIVAIGQKVNLLDIDGLGLHTNRRGGIEVEPDTLATNVPGIFAAGDVVQGAGTVTGSMAAGRKAAIAIDNYLKGRRLDEGMPTTGEPYTGAESIPRGVTIEKREVPPGLVPEVSRNSFAVMEAGFTPAQAVKEAGRCLRCKTCLLCVSHWSCVAIEWTKHGTKDSPQINGNLCGGCGVCIRGCPNNQIYGGERLD